MMTNEQLIQAIERAIRAGRVVTVADQTIRYCKRGEEFSDGDQHFQALATGVFLQMYVFEGRNPDFCKPSRTTWGYYVPLDELDVALQRSISRLSPRLRDELAVGLAFSAGLASLRAQESRVSSHLFDEFSVDHAPAV